MDSLTGFAGVSTRRIESTDILRPARSDREALLNQPWLARSAQARSKLPARGSAEIWAFDQVDGDLMRDFVTAAWSGGTGFSAMHANGEKPLPIASDGETELKSLVAGGASVLAANAENWSWSVAELHDHFVLGWGSPIDATVVMFERSVDLPIAAETLILALAGSARLLVGDEVTVLEEGYGVVTSGGTARLESDGPGLVLAGTIRSFGSSDVFRHVRRVAGFDPLFRADLPRSPDVPLSSYGGSLLDARESLRDRTVGLLESAWEPAASWWSAHLSFAYPRLRSPFEAAPSILCLPGPAAYLDDRFPLADGVAAVLMASTISISLSEDHLSCLCDAAQSPVSPANLPADLLKVLHSAHLLHAA